MAQTALSVVGRETGELSPIQMVQALPPQDKATIMSLCMPKGANDSELSLYLYRCKELGFDPLSGELVLRKFTNKDGSISLSFITTRDALLKKAEQNPNYMGMNSGVVREGDTFLVDTEKSIVHQTFGTKRGKILAGWAIVYHKTRLPVITTADFDEYFAANSSSLVWQKMPSAMIQKIAEVAALRRQFPILAQGVYTSEEMQTTEMPVPETVPVTVWTPEPPVSKPSTATAKGPKGPQASSNQESIPEPIPEVVPEVQFLEEAPGEIPPFEPEPQNQEAYKLLGLATGKSGTGVPYGKIVCTKGENKVVLIAKGEEGLAEAGKLSKDCLFLAETYEDKGFVYVKTITVL